jgi:hypothetical protein
MLSGIFAALSDDDEVPLLPASPPTFPGILLPEAQERLSSFAMDLWPHLEINVNQMSGLSIIFPL